MVHNNHNHAIHAEVMHACSHEGSALQCIHYHCGYLSFMPSFYRSLTMHELEHDSGKSHCLNGPDS